MYLGPDGDGINGGRSCRARTNRGETMAFRRVFARASFVFGRIKRIRSDTFHGRRTRETTKQPTQRRNHRTDARHQLCFISLRPFRFEPAAQSSRRGTGLPDIRRSQWGGRRGGNRVTVVGIPVTAVAVRRRILGGETAVRARHRRDNAVEKEKEREESERKRASRRRRHDAPIRYYA